MKIRKDFLNGAGDETRTHNPLLGRLCYSKMIVPELVSCPFKRRTTSSLSESNVIVLLFTITFTYIFSFVSVG